MANEAHPKILKEGIRAWNNWKRENPAIRPNLAESNLIGARLSGAILHGAKLSGASLYGTKLYGTNLSGAYLKRINLTDSEMYRTIFGNVDLSEAEGLETVIHAGPSTSESIRSSSRTSVFVPVLEQRWSAGPRESPKDYPQCCLYRTLSANRSSGCRASMPPQLAARDRAGWYWLLRCQNRMFPVPL